MREFKFYCHFNSTSLQVTAITPREEPAEGDRALEIPFDLGVKLLNGAEKLSDWVIGQVEGQFALKKLVDVSTSSFIDRLQVSGLQPVRPSDWKATWDWSAGLPDIVITLNADTSTVDVRFNYDALKMSVNPFRFYITARDDPTRLLGAYTITPSVLDRILADNELTEWPNPVRVAVTDIDDISIFAVKSPLSVVCETKETT